MATSTIVLFITVLVSICHQINGQQYGGGGPFPPVLGGRYRDTTVLKYFNQLCRRIQCGFEEVCERRIERCLIRPCMARPYCVPTPGASMKPGDCPHQSRLSGRRGIYCNTDYGCSGDLICCHGYGTSQCVNPRGSDYERPTPRRY